MTDLSVFDQGAGDHTIVAIHGGFSDHREWVPLAERLGPSNRVVTYDLRGHGTSPNIETPVDHVADLVGVLDGLGLHRTVIMGRSNGGRIATDFALAHPDRVEKLILIAPALSGYPFTEVINNWLMSIFTAPDLAAKIAAYMGASFHRVTRADAAANTLLSELFVASLARMRQWKTPQEIPPPGGSARDRLADVPKPLLLVGDHDSPDINGIRDLWRSQDADYRLIEGADHFAPLTHSGILAPILLDAISAPLPHSTARRTIGDTPRPE